jgi:Fe(3+) dicitrate transport protein
MNSKRITSLIAAVILNQTAFANHTDTVKTINLLEVEITSLENRVDLQRMPEIKGCNIYSGKKNEVINLTALQADLSTNNARQVFSKVPGVSVWENDGSGLQMGVATRGLSPNRSWEFNVRQNGYDISAEAFGYPESYFSPPLEALQSIELVRGSASLQYGPQFGGLLNYVLKKPSTKKLIEVESYQTRGSYGLLNSYNSFGGTFKKLSYFGYYHHRNANGWRENSRYHTNTAYASIQYKISNSSILSAEYTRMSYVSQQAGGLTDSMFHINARNSVRHRNWLGAPWNVASIKYQYQASGRTRFEAVLFGTMAQRNSVGFTKSIQIPDTVNTNLRDFAARQVDRDDYKNIGLEIRSLHGYTLGKQESALSVGCRLYNGNTLRRQLGIGTTGSDYDLHIAKSTNGKDWGRELNFSTQNIAFFAENLFKLSTKLSITPGLRAEWLQSGVKGYIAPTSAGQIPASERTRSILLAGIGIQYQENALRNVYANFSQSYRPVTFSELTPSATSDVIDPNIKDAKGYNIDLGYRGKLLKEYLSFDVSTFYLKYDNRIGTVLRNGVNYRTNIGTSVSKGVETLLELDLQKLLVHKTTCWSIKLSSSYAYVDARYTRWNNPAIAFDAKKSIENKQVEYAPKHIARFGLSYRYKGFSSSLQWNYVSEVFTDAANTESANATATVGKIPAYQVMDVNIAYEYLQKYFLKAGINNVGNTIYATRRASGYPGPGLLPANARTFFVCVGTKL